MEQHDLDNLLSKIDLVQFLGPLRPKDKGDTLSMLCPGCSRPDAYMKKSNFKIICNHSETCGYAATIPAYLNGGAKPQGEDFVNALRQIYTAAGEPFPEKQLVDSKQTRFTEEMEQLLNAFKQDVSEETFSFAQSRGIGRSAFAEQDLGGCSGSALLYLPAVCKATGIDEEWNGRFVMGVRDKRGKLRGFSARKLNEDGPGSKYKHTKGLDLKGLGAAGLDTALAKGNDSIILVEGLIDIYAWRALGFNRVAAICGSGKALTKERWEMLYSLGVRRVTLFLDNDNAGREGTEAAIDNSLRANPCPEIYAIDPRNYPDGAKDPGDLAKVWTKEDFERWEHDARHAYKLKALFLSERYDLSADRGRVDFITDAIQWDAQVPNADAARNHRLREFFIPAIEELSRMKLHGILDVRDQLKEKTSIEAMRTRLRNGLREAQDALNQGDLKRSAKLAKESARETEEKKDILSLAKRLPENTKRLADISGREFIGLAQKSIPLLDECTLGLRRMITIGGAPGTGKTMLMLQMMVDVLVHNPDACAVLVSWELTGDEIIDRIKSRLLGLPWKNLVLNSTAETRKHADQAMLAFADRFVIIEQDNCVDVDADLVLAEVEHLKASTGCSRAIVGLDYFQILPAPDSIQQYQEAQIEKHLVKEIKRIRYKLNGDPVLVISELNKNSGTMDGSGLEKLKGSVRLPYASDGVFMLNPLDDETLVKTAVIYNNDVGSRSRYRMYTDIPTKANEIKETAQEVRKALEQSKKDYLELVIAKFRDGGRKQRMFLTNRYELSTMEPGIQ